MLAALFLVATVVVATQAQTTEQPLALGDKHYYYRYPTGNYYFGSYYRYPTTYSYIYYYNLLQSLTSYYSLTTNTGCCRSLYTYYAYNMLSFWCQYCSSSTYGPMLCPSTAAATTAPPTTAAPTTTTTAAPTTTTTATPTTTAFTLCPAPASTTVRKRQLDLSNKIINGVTLDAASCQGDGLVGILQDATGVQVQSCNGVLATDPSTLQPVFYTSALCLDLLRTLETLGSTPTSILYGQQSTTTLSGLDLANAYSDSSIAIIPASGVTTNFAEPCEQLACVYTSAMRQYIDWSTCYVASYGTVTADALVAEGPNMASIEPGQNCGDLPTGSVCFTASGGDQVPCTSDLGAPVYCSLSTGEEVLYGVLALSANCDTANPIFGVMPV